MTTKKTAPAVLDWRAIPGVTELGVPYMRAESEFGVCALHAETREISTVYRDDVKLGRGARLDDARALAQRDADRLLAERDRFRELYTATLASLAPVAAAHVASGTPKKQAAADVAELAHEIATAAHTKELVLATFQGPLIRACLPLASCANIAGQGDKPS